MLKMGYQPILTISFTFLQTKSILHLPTVDISKCLPWVLFIYLWNSFLPLFWKFLICNSLFYRSFRLVPAAPHLEPVKIIPKSASAEEKLFIYTPLSIGSSSTPEKTNKVGRYYVISLYANIDSKTHI